MKALKTALFFWIFVGVPHCFFAQNIQVDDTYSAQQLVEDVLIDSPCANVSNFAVSGDTFSPGQQSYGYFTNTSPLFPFADGIVLSTARAIRSQGPNNNLIDEGATSWLGDQDLEQALNVSDTFNATVLEFDFTPLTSLISFDYIFASEEYSGSAPCRYSDGFAFLLKPIGSSQPYENLAVLPNTNTPVLVTTVHPEISGSCPAVNEMYFGGFNNSTYPVNFNGQTVVMTAKATVVPDTTYHIKLVIADEENIRYDSAIFLGGGSFHVGTDIGPDRLYATNNPVCEGSIHTLDATEPGSNTYQWFKNGNPILGATNPVYDVSDSGTYSVEINLGGTGCIATGEAVIEYTQLPVLADPTTLVQCDDDSDGITTFNLTKISQIVVSGNDSLLPLTYYPNLADAQNGVNAIPNPTAFESPAGNVVIARAENNYGCANYATVNLQIANNAIAAQPPIASCDNDGPEDGITAFNLDAEVTPQITSGLPSGLSINYYISAEDAVMNFSPLPDIFTNTTPFQQTIYALATNGPDCYGIIPVTLVVNAFDPAGFEDETAFLCNGNPVSIGVPAGFSSYVWNGGQTTPSITISSGGVYTVTVTDANGCSATKNFYVTDSQMATVTDIVISDFAGDGNAVQVNFTGNGDYEFSLFSGIWQSSALFTSVPPGEYQVLVRDRNGCGTTPAETIYVLDYPRFFTPNGDGYNDVWVIKNLYRRAATIAIFDRYGKLLKYQDSNTFGWDGIYNGNQLPASDYWFTITFENGRIVKGHFSLKR
jgi:gliding motility-associated-like protein